MIWKYFVTVYLLQSVTNMWLAFNVVFGLSVSDEMQDVFGICHSIYKFLTKAHSVKDFKTPTIIHLERERQMKEKYALYFAQYFMNWENKKQQIQTTRGCVWLIHTRSLMRGFSGVRGFPSLSLSASSSISST